MRRTMLPLLLLPLLVLVTPAHGQQAIESDSDYLQHRAAALTKHIDVAVKKHSITKKQAADLQTSVRQVQTHAGNLQTRNGTISREDADKMNQTLTDVERILTHQPE